MTYGFLRWMMGRPLPVLQFIERGGNLTVRVSQRPVGAWRRFFFGPTPPACRLQGALSGRLHIRATRLGEPCSGGGPLPGSIRRRSSANDCRDNIGLAPGRIRITHVPQWRGAGGGWRQAGHVRADGGSLVRLYLQSVLAWRSYDQGTRLHSHRRRTLLLGEVGGSVVTRLSTRAIPRARGALCLGGGTACGVQSPRLQSRSADPYPARMNRIANSG